MDEDYKQAWQVLGLPIPDEGIGRERGEEESRYVAFCQWIDANGAANVDCQSIVGLVSFEPDDDVRKSMYRLLIGGLAIEDLPRLSQVEEIRVWVEEETALRRLDLPLSEAELVDLAMFPSSRVQRKLVELRTPLSVTKILAENGLNKAIRNQAISRLRY